MGLNWYAFILHFKSAYSILGLCILGIRVLGDNQTDLQEARALSHRDDIISSYSNSWGPFDFGFIVEGPGPLVQRTFQIGTAEVSYLYIRVFGYDSSPFPYLPLPLFIPHFPLYTIMYSTVIQTETTLVCTTLL